MSRTIFIGDVHGCLEELIDLLKVVQPRKSKGDRIIFLGDLVDKGPDSLGVFRYVRTLIDEGYRVDVVMGNHDKRVWRWFMRRLLGADTECALADAWWNDLEHEDFQWLSSWPLFVRCREQNTIAVHGGIPMSLYRDFGELDARLDPRGKRGKAMEKLAHTRYVDENDEFVALGVEVGTKHHWSDRYDGRDGFAVFGHEPFTHPREAKHAIGIDTGCCYGGRLTALIVDESGARTIESVAARKVYLKREAVEE